MDVTAFLDEALTPGRFRDVISSYAQASLLQSMHNTACNALHDVKQRCCRWLLETRDRVDTDQFQLKQEFLAVMLGVRRAAVAVVLRALHQDGLISTGYGRIRIVHSRRLEGASCGCYSAIRAEFARLGL
jgi:CRP-like cAMP-binding protein